jgi:hypothetical protein
MPTFLSPVCFDYRDASVILKLVYPGIRPVLHKIRLAHWYGDHGSYTASCKRFFTLEVYRLHLFLAPQFHNLISRT